ncbi:MAG: sigma-70 family RNA polymerase sigma factor [Planctomycetes bacterium]|nr:sigma-70 family RNA polymerase sigma factor [Planctomycetota bacterium]
MSDGNATTTAELLRAARGGDVASLEALVARCRPRVVEQVRAMLGEGVRRWIDSGDVAHGAILDLLESFEQLQFASDRALMAWLATVARNSIRDESRRRRAHGLETRFGGADRSIDVPAAGSTPLTELDRGDHAARLRALLPMLGDDARLVVELRHFEGLSFRAIAERLGRSRNAVQLLHARALRRLGEHLERERGGPR